MDETWNMQRLEDKGWLSWASKKTPEVTVENHEMTREGQEMVFALLEDYTYQIERCLRRRKGQRANAEMLDMLEEMRRTRAP